MKDGRILSSGYKMKISLSNAHFLVNICFNDFTQEILESQHKNGRKNWCEKIFHMGREKGCDTWLEWWKEPMCVKYVVKKKLA